MPNDANNSILATLSNLTVTPAALLLPLLPGKDSVLLPPAPQTPTFAETAVPAPSTQAVSQTNKSQLLDAGLLATLSQFAQLGSKGLTSPLGPYDMGGGFQLDFDADTLVGKISPELSGKMMNALDDVMGLNDEQCFTGSDCRVMIDVDAIDTSAGGRINNFRKQLVEITTLSVSIHRVKTPARAFGYINPKGVARGTRTIAGTMVLTQGVADVLYRFMRAMEEHLRSDLSKDSQYRKIDQLPPFNLTLFFTNEYGHASFQKILGVEFVTDGVVRSINDMYTEQTITWLGSDFTPLMPLTVSTLAKAGMDARVKAERTVADVMQERAAVKKRADALPKGNILRKVPAALASVPVEVSPLPNEVV